MPDRLNRRRFLQASAPCAAAGALCRDGFAAKPPSGSPMLGDDGPGAAKVAPGTTASTPMPCHLRSQLNCYD